MKLPNANEFWIFYQLTVVFGTLVVIVCSILLTYFAWRFYKDTLSEMRSMERSLQVLKTDTLLRVKKERKSLTKNNSTLPSMVDEKSK